MLIRLFLAVFMVFAAGLAPALACIGDQSGKSDSMTDCEGQQIEMAPVLVKDAYAFETSEHQKNGAVFFTLKNMQKVEEIAVTGAESEIADHLEVHTMEMTGDVMKMRRVDKVIVGPREDHVFHPMGDHIMLMGLKQPLTEGLTFPVTLHVQCTKMRADGMECPAQEPDVTVEVTVRKAGHAKK